MDRDEIERLKRKLLDAELQSKRDTDEIERLTKEIASLKALLALSDVKVTDLEGQAKKDKDEIERLKRLLTDAEIKARKDENEIQLLKKQVYDLSSRFATAKATADKLIDELQEEIAALKSRIVDLEGQLDKNGKQGSDELAALKKRIVELEAALKKCTEDLSAATTAKAIADKQVEALTAQGKKDADEIAALKKRIAEVEAAKVLADRSIADLTAVHVPCATEIASLKKKIAELEATAAAVSDVKKNVLPSQTSANEGRGTRDDSDLARQIVELTKTNEQLQTHLVNLAKEFQSYKETSIASMAGSEEKAAQHIAQLQKERDTLAIKLGLASKDVNKAAASPSGNVPPLPPVPVAHSSSTPSTGKPDESEQARALVSLTNEYHVYKYTAENDLAVAQDTAASLRRANQLLQNEIDQLTEDFGAYKKMSEETIADIESLHAARYLRHFLLIHFLHL